MQFFKGDDLEKKFYNAGKAISDDLSMQKDLFLAGAYSTAPLGDVLYDSGRSPLANAITRDIFRSAFKEIFDSFVVAGTFESYLNVFKKIFGTSSTVTFTVPADGKLTITINATQVGLNQFVARTISNNQYIYEDMISQSGVDTLAFQTVQGFKTQYELEQMLFEMVPAGVFTTITLNLT